MSPRLRDGVEGAAGFSRDRRYRYRLERRWGEGPRVCWVLLNPSTADARQDDRTLARCIAFARSWGAGSVEVVNLFGLVSTDPAALCREPDPVGRGNAPAVRRALRRADVVVAGWGNLPRSLEDRAVPLAAMVAGRAWCLGLTKRGQPRHPLYLAGTSERVPFRAPR